MKSKTKNKEFCNDGTHQWVSDNGGIVFCENCKSLQEFVKGFPKTNTNSILNEEIKQIK